MGRFFLLCTMLALVADARADDDEYPYGAYFGTSQSSAEGRNTRSGIDTGFYAELPIVGRLVFRPEIAFVQKGSERSDKTVVRLDYVEVPLLIQQKISLGWVTLNVPIGIAGAYLISGDTVAADGGVREIDHPSIARNELSFLVGVGIELKIHEQYGVSLMARYGHGLTNVARFDENGRAARYFSRVVSLAIGITYDGSKQ